MNDLQATHQILELFEKTLSQTDAVLDNMSGVFALLNHEGTILKGNIQLANLYGVNHERLLGKSFFSILSPDRTYDFKQSMKNCLEKGVAAEIEVQTVNQQGVPDRYYIWSIARFGSWETGKVGLYSIVGKDVTDFRYALHRLVDLERDVEIAGIVQQLLLPKSNNVSLPSLDMVVHYESASKSGGDWWWYDYRQDGSVVVLLGDVTGHGLGAAMVTAVIAGSYRTHNRKSVPDTHANEGIVKTFEAIDENLKEFCENSYWFSLSAVEIFPKTKTIRWWNAGGPPLFIMDKDGNTSTKVLPGSLLGDETFNVSKSEIEYKSGDRLMMYTDGMFECKGPSGEMLKRNKLKNIFSATLGKDVYAAHDSILTEHAKFRQAIPLDDDASFALIDLK